MKRLPTVLALFSALLVFGAEKVRIADATGGEGNAVTGILLKFVAERPGVEISYRKLDAEIALDKLNAGDFDVVLVNGGDLPPKYRPAAFRYATGACIAVVCIKNPLRGVSLKELRMLVDVPRPNWELVGGSAADIRRYGVADRNGAPVGAKLLNLELRAREMLTFSTMNEAVLLAENDPEALVWGPFMPELPITVVALKVDGVAPTRANIRSGRYPLSIGRFAVGSANPGEAAKAFLKMLRSAEFARLAEDDGEIPELPEVVK